MREPNPPEGTSARVEGTGAGTEVGTGGGVGAGVGSGAGGGVGTGVSAGVGALALLVRALRPAGRAAKAPPERRRVGVRGGKPVGLVEAFAFEWTKLWTVRSTLVSLSAMASLIVGVSVVVGVTASVEAGDSIVASSLLGATLGQIPAATLGVSTMSAEYTSGLIRTTFAAHPRRLAVLVAKAALVAVAVFTVALAACGLAYQAGVALLGGEGYPRGELSGLFGVASCLAAAGVLGLAFGTVFRHPGGAVAAVLGVILLPFIVGPMLPGAAASWVVGASATNALLVLAASGEVGGAALAGGLGPWPSLAMVWSYAVAGLLVAGWLLRRRDA